jgi:hypothetical protein
MPSTLKMPQVKERTTTRSLVILYFWCRNPSLGLMTKARACEGAGQE